METSRLNVRPHEILQTFRCVYVRVGLTGLLEDHSEMKPDGPPDSVMDVSACVSVTGDHRNSG